MKVVVPMAGQSKRFFAAGYKVPKPFILVDKLPMIHWVIKMFRPEDEFIFVCLKEHMDNPHYREILETAAPKYRIIEIQAHSLGPVYSSLQADPFMDRDEPVIITYCDFYQHWNYQKFLMKVSSYDGGIAVFRGFQPASFGTTLYAYVKTNSKGEMIELREKQSFTENRHEEFASSGVYYFSSWDIFTTYGNEILSKPISVGGEYYVSLPYNLMVRDGLCVPTFEIDKFICWGTPEELEQFNFWLQFFKHDIEQFALNEM
jgi:NDP-sugar pyrophosphorylase family protein